MKKPFQLIALLLFIFLSVSCKKDKKEHIKGCTELFAYITITVTGDTLDNFFTIRNATGDTIRYEDNHPFDNNIYTVLNDNFQQKIKNKTEDFTFKGFIRDSLVIEEPYTIQSDGCHIILVSGNTEVAIES